MGTPIIAVTMGDPGGIGPEVLAAALADPAVRGLAAWRVLGLGSVMRAAAARAGIAPYWTGVAPGGPLGDADAGRVVLVDDELAGEPLRAWEAKDTPEGGRVSLAWVEAAIAMARTAGPGRVGGVGGVGGVVTGPISKAAWALAGERRYLGHTELFADRFGSPPHAMMFVSPILNVILVTAHEPLSRVPRLLTADSVLRAITLGDMTMRRLGRATPRIAVCGLNPHAGERGLLGAEDDRAIAPAIDAARRAGIDAAGPFPADTIFEKAVARPGAVPRYDLVVAMYHDQGLIPLKLLARDSAVNMTVGLPIVRTSPDHGTAFDIAGRGVANPGSMRAACEAAARLLRG